MRDRLSELVRQRALVSEHLAWLDREIANASVTPTELTPAAAAPPARAVPPVPAPAALGTPSSATHAAAIPAVTSENAASSTRPAATPNTPATNTGDVPAAASEEIIEQYRVSPATVKQDVRKGCLLYFVAAFVLLGIVIAILYFTIGTH